ncbi:ABC transporter ATP-binding protein [Ornithinibacillus halotolerans]|uniref:Macrolide ABC transporter ATP-binding protein n=1 Tax=Ornithinibacillus halotolerans TaxID=1274357 RepID=A0A916RTL2_9BACI|nr:ABC transporter ATP-binding protein [Ornithinibacillus halotolerans]GGA65647.1 macrolide ABC transporter ATP-binding protein [Ornithinibacillus halotolerans]
MPSIIQTDGLCKDFIVGEQTISVLKNINISIESGDFVSIMGPSGSGKSTLLYLLGGIDVPSSGTVRIDGKDINQMKDKEKSDLRRRTLGFVFQFYNLVQNLTVEENILLPVSMDKKRTSDYEKQLEEILEIVGLTERRKHTPRELSGGQQQRVAIARALILSPKIILADEPIGNLDSKTGTDIMKLFSKINKEKGITIVQVTHSEEAATYGNRLIRMRDGEVLEPVLAK